MMTSNGKGSESSARVVKRLRNLKEVMVEWIGGKDLVEPVDRQVRDWMSMLERQRLYMHVKDILMIVCLGVLKIDFCKFQDTGQKDNQRAPVSFRDVAKFVTPSIT